MPALPSRPHRLDPRRRHWDGLVVLCAANNWDEVKLADRHMAEHLSAYAPVLYVDPPDIPPDAVQRAAAWRHL